MTDAAAEYARRHEGHLRSTAAALQEYVTDLVAGLPNVERVTARAKEPESFAEKMQQLTDDGEFKYTAPLAQIQDQLGVRVIVLYLSTVDDVKAELTRFLPAIEDKHHVPENDWTFGYFGRHFVLSVPRDVMPAEVPDSETPSFFELQIKTLFQHAWSETNHDLGYKSPVSLNSDQQRRLAYTAAQGWGADQVFEGLRAELSNANQPGHPQE